MQKDNFIDHNYEYLKVPNSSVPLTSPLSM